MAELSGLPERTLNLVSEDGKQRLSYDLESETLNLYQTGSVFGDTLLESHCFAGGGSETTVQVVRENKLKKGVSGGLIGGALGAVIGTFVFPGLGTAVGVNLGVATGATTRALDDKGTVVQIGNGDTNIAFQVANAKQAQRFVDYLKANLPGSLP